MADLYSAKAFLIKSFYSMQNITAPTLLLDEDICKANIREMAEKAQRHDLQFKPHMKTHQSKQVGQWLKEAGVSAITVSSLEMARYFADDGWKDITIAFPANIRQVKEFDKLADIIDLTLLINNKKTARALGKELSNTVNAYIEIDTGSARTGLSIDDHDTIKNLITTFHKSEYINWIGFYSHAGHSYNCRSKHEILAVQDSLNKQFNTLKEHYEPNFGAFEVCSGDTPCCSITKDFGPVTAISPGNFVFYDLMQTQISSCSASDIAVAMTCPVVDQYPKRNELIIHGGAVHFSKESMTETGITHYGSVAERFNGYWEPLEDSYLVRVSQEHGVIRCPKRIFNRYDIGDLVTILPVHSCLTANLMKNYRIKSDNQTIIDMMK